MQQRKMVKIYRSDHGVQLYTYQRDRRRNGMFVLLDKEIEQLLDTGHLASFDGTHVAEFCLTEDWIRVQFRWGRGYDSKTIQSDIEWIRFPVETMRRAYQDMEPEQLLYALDTYDRPNYVHISFERAQERLREVLANPLTHHKFIKAIMVFQRWSSDRVNFYPDFAENSFYFEETAQGKRIMNGGLIWHGDRYGVHT